jgi:hypothetical protein
VLQLTDSNPSSFCTYNRYSFFVHKNFITDFKLTNLDCEMLNLEEERYIICEAKRSDLTVEITGWKINLYR